MNHSQTNKAEYNECIAKGICTISPALSYQHELIKEYIRELSFYLLKLKGMGIYNKKIKENIIDAVSGLVIETTYSEEQLYKIVTTLYTNLLEAKEMYTSICKKNNIKPDFLKSLLKVPKKIVVSEAIKQGQNIYKTLNAKTSTEQKYLFELIYFIIKSLCIHLIELKELEIDDEQAYRIILALYNIRNTFQGSTEKLHSLIEEVVKFDHELLMTLQEAKEEKYGKMVPVNVSLTTRANKAILVSGSNLRELEELLEATKDRNIDIYTHGHMIMAHSFPKFQKYPHLFGHFGSGKESYMVDFAAFPGAILLTKNSLLKTETLYRSRIFTTDVIAPKGVVIIKNKNYEPLIQSALNAKGFTMGITKPPIKLTLDTEKILKKIKEVEAKIVNGEIKHFFVIGVPNKTKAQKEYFEKFISLLNKDCFALSFSYSNGKDNVLLVETDYGYPIFYKSLDILTKNMTISDLNPIIFCTRCEIHTISHLLYMKYLGINKIYLTDCPPTLINPSIIETIRKIFDLKCFTTAEADFKEAIKK